ncbi:hypothetical protein Q1695_003974 [Nippostrongylus brasiliensis]|nr:hypothetical protein Q1695_003974 [Nippostrongylus brasiliensis]
MAALILNISALLLLDNGEWSDFGSKCRSCAVDLYNMDLCSSPRTCVRGTVYPTFPWTVSGSKSCVAKLYCPGSPTVTIKYASGKIEKGVSLLEFNTDYRLECFMDGTRSMTGSKSEVIAGFVCENASDVAQTSPKGADLLSDTQNVIEGKTQRRNGLAKVGNMTKTSGKKIPNIRERGSERQGSLGIGKSNAPTTTPTSTTAKTTTTPAASTKPILKLDPQSSRSFGVVPSKCRNPEATYSKAKKRCACKVDGSDLREREPERFKSLQYGTYCVPCSWTGPNSTTVFAIDESTSITPEQWENMVHFLKKIFYHVRDSYVSVIQYNHYARVVLPMGIHNNTELQRLVLHQDVQEPNLIAPLIAADEELQESPAGNKKTVILLSEEEVGKCQEGNVTCKSIADKWRKENTQLVIIPIGYDEKTLSKHFGDKQTHLTIPAMNFEVLNEKFLAKLLQKICRARKRS